MLLNRVVEYVFFFGLLGMVGLLLWNMFMPFITALAFAAVLTTICYPLYERIRRVMPGHNASLSALATTTLVVVLIILPIFWITSLLVTEALSIYRILNNGQYSLVEQLNNLEVAGERWLPGLEIDLADYLRQGARWFAGNLGAIFTGAASTLFSVFIAIISSFYFFRDGKKFMRELVRVSPLPDKDDTLIVKRMVSAIRGVAMGTILVAIIQGIIAAFGFVLFGYERAILFGTIVAIAALVPGIGPSVVFIPAGIYALFIGDYVTGIGILVWWLVAVSLIDNLLGPYLVSRSHPMHPFLILLSVLGGIFMFGPIGFIVGPVITSVFIVLLEIYTIHIAGDDESGGSTTS